MFAINPHPQWIPKVSQTAHVIHSSVVAKAYPCLRLSWVAVCSLTLKRTTIQTSTFATEPRAHFYFTGLSSLRGIHTKEPKRHLATWNIVATLRVHVCMHWTQEQNCHCHDGKSFCILYPVSCILVLQSVRVTVGCASRDPSLVNAAYLPWYSYILCL
jgi:hypothetical protein